MPVFNVTFEATSDNATVAVRLRMGHRSRRLVASASAGALSSRADFLLPLLLPVAMHHGADIEIDRPVSQVSLDRLPETMAYMARWNPRLRPVRVLAESLSIPEREGEGGIATFFSGGIDSFYTFLTHRNEVDTLVFLHGFDIPLRNRRLRGRAAAAVKAAGDGFGVGVLEIETNWRAILDEYADWEPQGHRLFMAAAGLLMAPRFGRVYVPAGYVSQDLVPARTDPGFYPAWSRPDVQMLADGVAMPRVEKVRLVAAEVDALRDLRVCWENRGNAYNCGRCEKCLRTMATLRILGALDRCPAFDRDLDLEALARVQVYDESLAAYLQENLDLVRRQGNDPPLELALEACLKPRARLPRRLSLGAWRAQRALADGGLPAAVDLALRKRAHLW